MLSFYDWYADLPVASPQVFGDQTDVPESGDWWNAGYLIMWGSNLPVTRTPDAHWMTEARYRGQKVIAVAPDYADNVKFADEWLPAKPGTDAALAMAMGHVVLKEFFVDRADAVLHRVREDLHRPAPPRPPRGGRPTASTRPASSSPPPTSPTTPARRTPRSRPCSSTRGPASPSSRTAPWATATARPAWASGTSTSATSTRSCPCSRPPTESVVVRMPRFDTPDGAAADLPRGVPGAPRRRPPGHHRLRPAAGAVRRRPRPGLPGAWPTGYDDAQSPYTPAWQEAITGVPAATAARIGREFAAERRGVQGPLDDRHGRRHQPLVPLRHDLPRLPHPDQPDRLPGRQRRRLGPLRRPGEGPPDHRLHPDRQRAGLEPAAAQHDPDRVLVPAHRPVPLRPVRRRHPLRDHRQGPARRQVHRRRHRPERPDGLDAVVPHVRPQPARPQRRRGRRRQAGRASTSSSSSSPATSTSPARTPTPRATTRGSCRSGGPTCSAPRARATSTSSSTCSAPTPRCARPRRPRTSGPST